MKKIWLVTIWICSSFCSSSGYTFVPFNNSDKKVRPIIHFINVDKALHRKEFMMSQFAVLGFESIRLRAFTESDISIPSSAFISDCNKCHRDKESCNKHFLGKIVPKVWMNESSDANRYIAHKTLILQ